VHSTCDVSVAGEKMIAMADKALFWPAESTLFVADVHLGKDAAMLASAIPIPLGSTTETLCRLSHVLDLSGAKSLILLGDLWHAKAGRTPRFTEEFVCWRRRHASVKMLLVEGNHDLKSGPLPAEADVTTVSEPHAMGPFALCHMPEPRDTGYVLSGHIHPGVVMEGMGRQSVKLPCFWFGPQAAVLPAFGVFTGCASVRPASGDQVFVVFDGKILSVG